MALCIYHDGIVMPKFLQNWGGYGGMIRRIATCIPIFILSACQTILSPSGLPRTIGEVSSGYGYVPLDALPVLDSGNDYACQSLGSDKYEAVPLLEALPDLSIRFAVGSIDANGNLAFGPSQVTASGSSYKAVLDYVNVDDIPVTFRIARFVNSPGGPQHLRLGQPAPPGASVGYDVILIPQAATPSASRVSFAPSSQASRPLLLKPEDYELVTIPVYVGVGLRLSADVLALHGKVALSGLGAIGAAAEANKLTGTLTVQTLGVNGKSVATALPLPSKLDQTTIEAGILAIGSARAVLYNASSGTDALTTTLRVVGLYSPIGSDPILINAIYSELSKSQQTWQRNCRLKAPASPAKPKAPAAPKSN